MYSNIAKLNHEEINIIKLFLLPKPVLLLFTYDFLILFSSRLEKPNEK